MPEEQNPAASDFIAEDLDLPTTAGARWNANIRALRTLKQLESEGRRATPAEQEILAQYSGFGDSSYESAFRNYRPRDGAEADRWDALRDVATDEELASIKRSRLNAFYTNPEIIKTMWRGLDDMGAGDMERIAVLEPSAGAGRFLTYQPEQLARKSERTAVELDSLTGRLLAKLHPDTEVWQSGFEAAPLPDNHYDIAISNVPFGDYAVHDPEYVQSGRKYLTQQGIHNYFFAKSLDKLKPGGVLAFITSKGTLDAPSRQEVREYLTEQADMVGAVRLPEDVFPDTSVVTDIIYLRKRKDGDPPGDAGWVETGQVELKDSDGSPKTFPVNRYFLDNPDRVLGRHSAQGSMYRGGSYTVTSDADADTVQGELEGTVQGFSQAPAGSGPILDTTGAITANPSSPTRLRGDGMYQKGADGALQVQKQGSMVKPSLSAKDAEKVSRMVDIRDTAGRLMDMEASNDDEGGIEATRLDLKGQYDRFVKKHGNLNSRANLALMQQDPGALTLAALEVTEKGGKSWTPATVLSRRVIGRAPERSVGTPNDAMLVTLNETGQLDFDHMAQQLGDSPEAVRASLERDRLIFRNPVSGHYETASTYLTGDVREKHRIARQYAGQDPRYQANLDALAEVLPPKVEAHEIATPLGAPWIPEEMVNRWAYEHLTRGHPWAFDPHNPGHRFFAYNQDNGRWYQPRDMPLDPSRAYGEFGTRRRGADEILLAALQGKSLKVTSKTEDGVEVQDPEATLAVQEKARAIQKSFEEWLWRDEARKEYLAERYNDVHNSVRPRVFDGSHQTFPGMAAEWQEQMREHQRDAVFRTVHDGTALLAHEVGFGKTAVMVASAMERKRLGLSSKAVFVVPKATHQQFAQQFLEIYPNAKLLSPEKGDFSTSRRQAFLNRMVTGDWDGIVLTGEQFEKIPVSPELEHRWIQEQKWEYQQALAAMREAHQGGRKGRQKELEKKIADFEARLQTLRAEMNTRTDDGAVRHFDKMGIDQLYVDEADRYKNLQLHSQMGDVKGMPTSGSKRALDMLMKVRHVQEKGGESPSGFTRNGVVFATGTPIANTIAEAWTMMRYLQLPELRKRGLQHFDGWAKTYGEITEGLEATPQGTYKNTQRFAKFVNLPELSQLFQNVADIRVASEVPAMLEAQPCLIDDDGNAKRITVVSPSHEPLREYMDHVRQRVERLGSVDPREDNMLKVSTDSRKAALDLRMIDPTAPPNPKGKIQMAAQNIAENFKNEAENFGTQLVFLDYGTPKARDTRKEPAGDDEGQSDPGETAEEVQELSNLYGTLKKELVARGVPEDQVAFVHDAKTDQARQKLFDAVNRGEVRILVGSTEKVGVGVNVQERAYAAHHLDVPWRPRDVEQREGRIIRQGNKVYGPVVNPESKKIVGPGQCVRIYQYVQEGSFDEFMWQAVEVKANAIKSLMRRNITSRSADDIDNIVLSASEARALASGNPLVLEREKLRNEVRNLRLARDSHRTQQDDARLQLNFLGRRIEGYRNSIPKLTEDVAHVTSLAEDAPFDMTVAGSRFDKRPEAGRAMEAAMNGLPMVYDLSAGSYRSIGSYRGFDVRAVKSNQGWQLQLVNPATEVPHSTAWIDDLNPAGLPSRLDNLVRGIPRKLADSREKLQEAESSISTYEEQLHRPFERGEELQEAQRKLASVQARMTGQGETDQNDSELVEELLNTSDYDDGGSGFESYGAPPSPGRDAAPPAPEAAVSEPEPPAAAAGTPVQADTAPGLRPDGNRSFRLPTHQDTLESQSAPEATPDVAIRSVGADAPDAGSAPETGGQSALDEQIALMEQAAEGRADVTLAGAYNLAVRNSPTLTVEQHAILRETYQRLKDVKEARLSQQAEQPEQEADALPPEPSPVSAGQDPVAATEAAADPPETSPEATAEEAAPTVSELLQGRPKSLGGRGRNREWGGLVTGSPQVGQTVTIVTKRGKTFEKVVGEILQTTPDGAVVRWATESAPGQPEEPPAAPGVPRDPEPPSLVLDATLETLHDRNEANLESAQEDLSAREEQAQELREELADADTPEERQEVAAHLEHIDGDRDDLEGHVARYEAVDDSLDAPMGIEEPEQQDTLSSDADPGESEPQKRPLVTDPLDTDLEVDLSDPTERGLMAGDALAAMPPDIRQTHDELQERLGDLLDEYELTILARQLGPNPSPEALDQEEARLRRQGALNAGQVDMFGATADTPDTLLMPGSSPPLEPAEPGAPGQLEEQLDVLNSLLEGKGRESADDAPHRAEPEAEEAADSVPVAEPEAETDSGDTEDAPAAEEDTAEEPADAEQEPVAEPEVDADAGTEPVAEPAADEASDAEAPPTAEEVGDTAEATTDAEQEPADAGSECNALLVKRKPRGDGYNILDNDEAVGAIVQQGSNWLIKRNNRKVVSAETLTAAKNLLDDPEVCGQLRQKEPTMAVSGPAPSRAKAPSPKVKPLIEHPKGPKKPAEKSGKTNRGKGIARIKRRLR